MMREASEEGGESTINSSSNRSEENFELWELLHRSKERLEKRKDQLLEELGHRSIVAAEDGSGLVDPIVIQDAENDDFELKKDDQNNSPFGNFDNDDDEEADITTLLTVTQQRLHATTAEGVVRRNSILHKIYFEVDEESQKKNQDLRDKLNCLMVDDSSSSGNKSESSDLQQDNGDVKSNDNDEDDDAEKKDTENDRLFNKTKRLLKQEIMGYSPAERELLIAMVVAEEAAKEGVSDFIFSSIDREALEEDLEESGGMDAIIESLCRESLVVKEEQRSNNDDEIIYEDEYIRLSFSNLILKNYYKEDSIILEKTIPLSSIQRIWLGTDSELGLNYFTKSVWGIKNGIYWAKCNSRLTNDDRNNFVICTGLDYRHGFTVADHAAAMDALSPLGLDNDL